MTKSEAKAIHEGAFRAIRTLNGVDFLKLGLTGDQLQAVTAKLATANDEVQRIADMASAELSK